MRRELDGLALLHRDDHRARVGARREFSCQLAVDGVIDGLVTFGIARLFKLHIEFRCGYFDFFGLVAGFVGGYMMLGIEKMCSKFPRALEGIKPVLVYPLLGLGGVAVLMCAINPIMGWINTGMTNVLKSMADSGLIIPLCALLAGMMAIDMGGPFNKAAYVFATGMLASQTDAAYMIMAAVMIGGMVPPIAIALSTTFFKSRWTDEERRNAPVNYIMGLSFITEGAIPYAAGHPLQVIPSCIVGSAAAGALSAIFQCKLMAPHGGVFVFATMQGTWMFYILALLIGAVLGMIMLAILKRPIDKK